jgi:hypothetical protein
VSQNGIAAELSNALHRSVRAETVPRENWGAIFRAQGMRDPIPRIQMLDGFNEGSITFEGGGARLVKGKVNLAEVIRKLVGEHVRATDYFSCPMSRRLILPEGESLNLK